MKKWSLILTIILILCLLSGCSFRDENAQIATTTLPVYEFTKALCQGTELTVGRLVTENVSCLHDYSLQVSQMRQIEQAELIVLSGLGLEDFLMDALQEKDHVLDASVGITPICPEENHAAQENVRHDHVHEEDPHIWLSPLNAKVMAQNICNGLSATYPEQKDTFKKNLVELEQELDALYQYGVNSLSSLKSRQIVTFHDGFSYFAQCFDLEILRAIEEESGREASASELKELIMLVEQYHLPAIFTETNGSVSAADVIATQTNCKVYTLDMAMSGDSYFDSMYHNIDAVKEALE